MKKLLCIFMFLITAQTSASNFDVIYHFEGLSQNDDRYISIKIDFDYVSPDVFGDYLEQVFGYDEFLELSMAPDPDTPLPIFYFEFAVVDTNIPFEFMGPSYGFTHIVANDRPLVTNMGIPGFGSLEAGPDPLDALHFPTGWEPGNYIYFDSGNPGTFVLTEVTPIPLPAAFPLFGFSLLLLARSKRNQ